MSESVRRVSNRSQQGLFRGETLNLTRKNAEAAFFIDVYAAVAACQKNET